VALEVGYTSPSHFTKVLSTRDWRHANRVPRQSLGTLIGLVFVDAGLKEKAKEFVERGSELYVP
jgi:AraC-like DNA-binding protein